MIWKASAVALFLAISMGDFHQSSSLTMNDFPGLVRHYTGDNTLVDATGSGSDLTIPNGGPARYETVQAVELASKSRGVFELNGSNSAGYWLKASGSGLPTGNLPRTMLGWARIDAPPNGEWAQAFSYGKPCGCGCGFDFGVRPVGLQLDFHCPIDGDISFSTDYNSFQGQWRHYTFTFDGTTYIIYIDGVNVLEHDLTSPANTVSDYIVIGGNQYRTTYGNFYGAIAEVAVFNRVLTASEVIQIANMDTAGGGGDPHFYGFGGSLFTWQGECDTVLFKSPKNRSTDSDIEVHIRTRMIRTWSVIDTIALKVNNFIGEIQSQEGKLIADRNEVESVHLDFLSVEKKRVRKKIVLFTFVIDADKVLEVKVNTKMGMIFTTLSGNYPSTTVGLLGSPNSPGQFSRDGIEMTGKNVNDFAESWQVNHSDQKLFIESRDPQYPDKCIYKVSKSSKRSRRLRETKMIKMEDAVAACAYHKPGPFREFCVDDVYNSGDLDIGKDSFYG